jgi:hypothetical protein
LVFWIDGRWRGHGFCKLSVRVSLISIFMTATRIRNDSQARLEIENEKQRNSSTLNLGGVRVVE